MELSSSGDTNDFRLPKLFPFPLPPTPAAVADAARAQTTAKDATAETARRPPRPQSAFERDSPREPRPQRAFERLSLLLARLDRIYPSSHVRMQACTRAAEHIKPAERTPDAGGDPPPEGSGPGRAGQVPSIEGQRR